MLAYQKNRKRDACVPVQNTVYTKKGSTANPYTLTLTSDTSLTAIFAPVAHDTTIVHDTIIVPDTVPYFDNIRQRL